MASLKQFLRINGFFTRPSKICFCIVGGLGGLYSYLGYKFNHQTVHPYYSQVPHSSYEYLRQMDMQEDLEFYRRERLKFIQGSVDSLGLTDLYEEVKSMSKAEKASLIAKAEKRKTEYNKNLDAYNKKQEEDDE